MELDKLIALTESIDAVKETLKEMKAAKTEKEVELETLTQELIGIFEENGLKTFDNGGKKFTIVNKPYAKIIDRDALAEYLKAEDLFNDFYTFNATKMNSYYNECYEIAKENMELDFEIPGMDATSIRKTLQIRKGK